MLCYLKNDPGSVAMEINLKLDFGCFNRRHTHTLVNQCSDCGVKIIIHQQMGNTFSLTANINYGNTNLLEK